MVIPHHRILIHIYHLRLHDINPLPQILPLCHQPMAAHLQILKPNLCTHPHEPIVQPLNRHHPTPVMNIRPVQQHRHIPRFVLCIWETIQKRLDAPKEDGAYHLVHHLLLVPFRGDRPDHGEIVARIPGEHEAGEDDTNRNGDSKVEDECYSNDDEYDEAVGAFYFRFESPAPAVREGEARPSDNNERLPFDGEVGHHKHNPGQTCHRYGVDKRVHRQNNNQHKARRHTRRKPCVPARVNVHQTLSNRGAPAHTAEHTAEELSRTLSQRLAASVTFGAGEFVDDLEGEEGLEESDGSDGDGNGEYGAKGFTVERWHLLLVCCVDTCVKPYREGECSLWMVVGGVGVGADDSGGNTLPI